MAHSIRRVDYFHVTVQDRPGEALKTLSALADLGISLVAFTAIPAGMMQTQLTIFPEDSMRLTAQSRRAGLTLEGPHPALLVQGEDVPGDLVAVHERLHEAGVNVYQSTGVSSGKGSYGYIIHVRPTEFDRAAEALGV